MYSTSKKPMLIYCSQALGSWRGRTRATHQCFEV